MTALINNDSLPESINKAYQIMWDERQKVIEQYLPKSNFINKSYQHRRNIWRNNVKKSISKFFPVPDWFINLDSFKIKENNKPKLEYNYIDNKKRIPYFLFRFVQFIKKLFIR